MSRAATNSSLKRKRPDDALADDDRKVLDVIKSTEDMGILKRHIKYKTQLADNVLNKSLKSLGEKKLIKDFQSIDNKGMKIYMAAEFQPSDKVTGGSWYTNGQLDKEFIDQLKAICLRIIEHHKVSTVGAIHDIVVKKNIAKCSDKQIKEILNSMILDNAVIEVKSSGWGDYHSFPVGTLCYRLGTGAGVGKGVRIGAMASMPCGMCPRINQCTPDGIISPATCVYFKSWSALEF